MGDKSTSATDEVSLAKKLMLIVATDLMCWVSLLNHAWVYQWGDGYNTFIAWKFWKDNNYG